MVDKILCENKEIKCNIIANKIPNTKDQLMPWTRFEDLEIYRLAEELSDQIWTIARSWDHFTRSTIGGQIADLRAPVCPASDATNETRSSSRPDLRR